ncbi:hypothetical protein [Sphingobacterium mizutaii]|uniref:hypothetical protein n=1 Tax=Sphingobacterium mizutaii TaxID=1010 RepID=UPI0016262BF5|nr:hypothetical protein [Sphingobacterium mizutaii]
MGCEERTVFYFLVSLFWVFFIYYLAMAIRTLLARKASSSPFRFSREDWYGAAVIFCGCSALCAMFFMVVGEYLSDGLHPGYYLLAIPLALVSALIHKILS